MVFTDIKMPGMDGLETLARIMRDSPRPVVMLSDADTSGGVDLTLRALEAQLLIMAHTLGNVTPLLHQNLMQVDWNGWAVLHDKLRNGLDSDFDTSDIKVVLQD